MAPSGKGRPDGVHRGQRAAPLQDATSSCGASEKKFQDERPVAALHREHPRLLVDAARGRPVGQPAPELEELPVVGAVVVVTRLRVELRAREGLLGLQVRHLLPGKGREPLELALAALARRLRRPVVDVVGEEPGNGLASPYSSPRAKRSGTPGDRIVAEAASRSFAPQAVSESAVSDWSWFWARTTKRRASGCASATATSATLP